MSEKNSIARRNRWAKISPEERSEMMSRIATTKWANKTKQERIDHAMKMVKARNL